MKKLSRLAFVSQAIIGIAGCATVAVAVYITKSATPLWALILVSLAIPKFEYHEKSDDNDICTEDGEE
jgi:hypothetical protein